MKKVLGLDIGSNSIGFSLLELDDDNGITNFNEMRPLHSKVKYFVK